MWQFLREVYLTLGLSVMTFGANVKAAAIRNLAVAFACLLLLMTVDILSVSANCTKDSVAILCSSWFAFLVFFAVPVLGFFAANLPLYRQEKFPWKYVFPLGWAAYSFALWFIPAFVFNIWFLFLIGASK